LSELDRARVAFRRVSRSDDRRTVRACIVPKGVFLADSAPYLVFVEGSAIDQSTCLGIINSLPFDWQVRRLVEANINHFLLEALTVPNLDEENYIQVAQGAARLSAVDDSFNEFAISTGVTCGQLTRNKQLQLKVDIDARIARAWQLTVADLETMLEDFTNDAVPPAYREALIRRFLELS